MTLKEAIDVRTSVRSYDAREIAPQLLAELNDYISQDLPQPFVEKLARVLLLSPDSGIDPSKFGTYGVIRGAKSYMALLTCPDGDNLRAALSGGYVMEHAILKATALGLGSCWLGGTLHRGQFAEALTPDADEHVVAVTPLGYPSPRRRTSERLMRFMVSASRRKPFAELFFAEEYGRPYPADGALADTLEAVRRAPSATNRQPWRAVICGDKMHLYAAPDPNFRDNDMGIAMAHFDIHRGSAPDWFTDESHPEAPYPYIISTHI